jgi:hypothetical protein
MKKLIAIAVVFVLVAGAAFAEVSVSGGARGQAKLGKGSSTTVAGTTTNGENEVSGSIVFTRIQASGQNEDGTFGATARLDAGAYKGGITTKGSVWWKPIPQVKLQYGTMDGEFGFDAMMGWGFYQGDNDGIGIDHYMYSSQYGGSGDNDGLFVTVSPVGGLDVNIYIPLGSTQLANRSDPWETYAKTHLQIKYGIDNIGTFALSYAGDTYGYGNGPNIYAGFELTALEGLSAFLGAKFNFPTKKESTVGIPGTSEYKITQTTNGDVAIGLGAAFASGGFGIKATFELAFGALTKTENTAVTSGFTAPANTEAKGATKFLADLFPYYSINDNLKVGLGGGMSVSAPDGGGTPTVDYRLNPFVSFSSGGGTFWAGFYLKGSATGSNSGSSEWGIPITIGFNF